MTGLRGISAALLMTTFTTSACWAQENGVWIQIEAQPTLAQARERAQDYAAQLPDVNGYDLGRGWFGIALGPYSQSQAASVLRQLRGSRAIPSDSYVVDGSSFRDQFWPVGGTVQATSETPIVVEIIPEPEPEPIIPADETPQEARATERLLTLDEKKELQIALQWAGFYNSSIDGLYGRGTRNSMGAWQEANNFELTGILTTSQRAELLRQYNAVLEGMDMAAIRDDAAGIEMQIPTGVVAFNSYSPPFARYDASGDLEAQVLLISQPGDQDRLFGLYEIMQTLEIIPADGPRERNASSFTIEGMDSQRHSYTFARLTDGEIKGFTLVWPAGDEERRSRILGIMRDSFARIDGVLDPGLVDPGEEQSLDLVSGLSIRQPILSRSGFYIDGGGTVITTSEAVEGCGEILLDNLHAATVAHLDADLGVAVLAPVEPIAPLGRVSFQTSVPRLQSQVAVAGYPYSGLLSAPSLVFGTLADIRGLNGEDDIKRITAITQEGDAGGPVFDNSGAVIGMLLPAADGRVLPADTAFIADTPAILTSLDAAGISYSSVTAAAAITPERLTRDAANATVLVSCW